ncbi:MAG: glycoside hydrolase family 18 protein [Sulfurovum sp.]|nr:glycoside hydrolase family 18 protein [Sulfurovum sp.]
MKYKLTILTRCIMFFSILTTSIYAINGTVKPIKDTRNNHFSVGYLPSWSLSPSDIKNIDTLYNYVLISFAKPDLTFDGKNWLGLDTTGIEFNPHLGTMDEYKAAFKSLQDRGVKILLAVGGGTFSHGNGWSKFIDKHNDTHRKALKNLIDYLNLDGIDIDYERGFTLNAISDPDKRDKTLHDVLIPEYVNVILAMKDIVGDDKMLTIATGSVGAECSQEMVDNKILKCNKVSYQRYLPGFERLVFDTLVNKNYKLENIFDHISIMSYDSLSKENNNLRADPIGIFKSYREIYSGPLAMGFNPAPEAASTSELVTTNLDARAKGCRETSMINGSFSKLYKTPEPYSLERFIKYLKKEDNSGIMVWSLAKVDSEGTKTTCQHATTLKRLNEYVNKSKFIK